MCTQTVQLKVGLINKCPMGVHALYRNICHIQQYSFFLRTFIVPFHTKLLGYYRDTVSRCHPRLLHTVQLPLHLGSDGPDWDPLEHLVLSIPCLATDPAVIEGIRLVNAAHIRLGGPKRQKGDFLKGNPGITGQPREKCGVPS